VPIEFRARAMSLLGGVIRIGLFIGPFLGAVAIHRFGLAGAYGVGIAASCLSALVAARLPDVPAHAPAADAPAVDAGPAAGPTLFTTMRDHRHVFATLGVGMLLVNAVRASRQAVIPLWADHLGLEPSLASLVYGMAAGIEMLVFYPAGVVMDRKGRRWVAVPAMLLLALGLMLMPLTEGAASLLLATSLIGLGNGIGSGMGMTLGADHSPRIGRAHFLGVWRLVIDVGTMSGPAMLSVLTAALSLGAGIAATGLIALAAAAQLAYWIPRTQARRP
jgi:MFS family permease